MGVFGYFSQILRTITLQQRDIARQGRSMGCKITPQIHRAKLQHRDATRQLVRDASRVSEVNQVGVDIVSENLASMRIADTIPLEILVIGLIDQLTPTGIYPDLKLHYH